MSTFQKVKDRLSGCRPFAWYLRRFKAIYEDGGIVPPEIFMIREEKSGKCLHFKGHAGTSGSGHETVQLDACNPDNNLFFWHLGNVNRKTGRCCSGLRAWNTEQCFQGVIGKGKAGTGICEVTGRNGQQVWALTEDGQLKSRDRCMGPGDKDGTLTEAPCISFRSKGGARFTKQAVRVPIETELYQKAQREHPETFRLLNQQLAEASREAGFGPPICKKEPGSCMAFFFSDGSQRCLDDEGQLTKDKSSCAALRVVGKLVQRAETGDCLDTWSDMDQETWGFYGCHSGDNQLFAKEGGSRVCTTSHPQTCFLTQAWPVAGR